MTAPSLTHTSLIDSFPDATVMLDPESLRITHVNPATEVLSGWTRDELEGQPALDLLHPDDVPLAMAGMSWLGTNERGAPIELRINTRTGGELLVELSGGLHRDESGDFVLLVLRDLTARRRWEIAHDDNATLRALIHHAGSLLIHLDEQLRIASASSALTRDLGHDLAIVEGRPFVEIVHIEDRQAMVDAIAGLAVDASGGRTRLEARLSTLGGRATRYQLEITSLASNATVDGYVLSGHDITELDTARRKLAHAASHDSLTGLLNRAGFEESLTRSMADHDVPLSVIFLDLDRFKPINDTFGHHVGDRVLDIVARRLAGSIRERDYAARFGGDEFAIAVHATEPGIVERLIERVRATIDEPIVLGEKTITIRAAIGYASCDRHASPAEVIAAADSAMYRNKTAQQGLRHAGRHRSVAEIC